MNSSAGSWAWAEGVEKGSILITCFEPFGGRKLNVSSEAARLLPERAGERRLFVRCLPVAFGLAAEEAAREARALGASAILSLGEAGGRRALTPELVGLNLRYARIPDNLGHCPLDEPVVPGGPNALFSTLPARRMAAAIAASGLPGEASYSAGAYVCNDLFYGLLYAFRHSERRCGFLHLPAEDFSPEELARGVLAAIEAIGKEDHHAIPQG